MKKFDRKEYMREYMKMYRLRYLEKFREDSRRRIKDYAKRTHNAFSKRWAKKNKEKVKAERLLNVAIKKGNLKRKSCRDCGSVKVHGHHYDYTKPLSVIWLCPAHHKAEHVKSYA